MSPNTNPTERNNRGNHIPNYRHRLTEVRERIKSAGLDLLIVTEPHNIFYLSGSNGGYTGARTALVVDHEKSILLIDSRYIEETKVTATADSIQIWASAGYADVVNVVRESSKSVAKLVGFEATHVTVKQFERLSSDFAALAGFTGSTELNGSAKSKKSTSEAAESAKPIGSTTGSVGPAEYTESADIESAKPEFRLVGTTGIVEAVREVKDQEEIAKIQAAARIADLAFDYITSLIKPGATEKEIALELDYFMLRNGAERVSFDTIVASGKNSAVPHATPSNKKIEPGDFVKLDFGAVVEGYHSDMTRTVVVGKANNRQREIYSAVMEAQEKALLSVKAGLVCEDIDMVARRVIEEKGFGECFLHNLGHGVGLQIHEAPSLGKNCKTILQPGMVVTVEPGVYVNGFGGVRIEDLVVVTESGCEILSKSTKELLEI